MGRLVSETNSKDNIPSVFRYDSNSLMKTAADATGTYSFSYDEFGRLTRIKNPDNKEQIYTYDDGSNIKTYEQVRIGRVEHKLNNYYDKAGRLVKVETPAGVVKYEYDGVGRLTREENLGSSVNAVYTYSLFNEIAGIDIFKNDELEE
ncbi:MAG: RHS repeat protein, partial [Clostridiaceae bacterium]|nr:RHS repeat protein [Clostridiaceae bacterium]